METIRIDGKEVRFWNPSLTKIEKDANGADVTVLAPGWEKKPTSVEVQKPAADMDEILSLVGGSLENLAEAVFQAKKSEAEEKAGTPPEGAFSKAQVTLVVNMLGGNDSFRNLARSEKRDAVMNFVSKPENEVLRTALYTATAYAHSSREDSEE